jgi:hypothetical protein
MWKTISRFGLSRGKVLLLELLVDDEEYDVPRSHAHEGGHEAAVEREHALVLDRGQAAVDGRPVNLFRVILAGCHAPDQATLVHKSGSNHI